jgi:hypothetical protein
MALTTSRNEGRGNLSSNDISMTSPISDKWRAALCCFWGLCTPLMSHGADFFFMDHDAFTGRYTGPVGNLW